MDIMIDIETLGTGPDTVVLSIGAVAFTDEIKGTFYTVLNGQDQIDKGRSVTQATINWWMTQNTAAKDIFMENSIDNLEMLTKFKEFCLPYPGDTMPWGNGSGFDVVIMETLLDLYGVCTPWKFWNARDLRTFKQYTYADKSPFVGVKHNALDDARHEAKSIINWRIKCQNQKK